MPRMRLATAAPRKTAFLGHLTPIFMVSHPDSFLFSPSLRFRKTLSTRLASSLFCLASTRDPRKFMKQATYAWKHKFHRKDGKQAVGVVFRARVGGAGWGAFLEGVGECSVCQNKLKKGALLRVCRQLFLRVDPTPPPCTTHCSRTCLFNDMVRASRKLANTFHVKKDRIQQPIRSELTALPPSFIPFAY